MTSNTDIISHFSALLSSLTAGTDEEREARLDRFAASLAVKWEDPEHRCRVNDGTGGEPWTGEQPLRGRRKGGRPKKRKPLDS